MTSDHILAVLTDPPVSARKNLKNVPPCRENSGLRGTLKGLAVTTSGSPRRVLRVGILGKLLYHGARELKL